MFRFLRSRLRLAVKLTALTLLFFFSLSSANANPFLDQLNWAARGSILYFASDNGRQGADPGAILPSLGGAAVYHFRRGPFRLELSTDIYMKNYEYNRRLVGDEDSQTYIWYPMPCNPENRSAFVLGFLTGLQLTGSIPIGRSGFGVRIFGGPCIDIRIVTLAIGLKHPADFTGEIETDAQMQADAIREYFWSENRWFFPVAGIGVDIPINERFLLGLDLRAWFPLYRQWTDQELPRIDGWRFGAGFRITPRIPPRQARAARQANQPANENVFTSEPANALAVEDEPVALPEEHFYFYEEGYDDVDLYEEELIEEIYLYEEESVDEFADE